MNTSPSRAHDQRARQAVLRPASIAASRSSISVGSEQVQRRGGEDDLADVAVLSHSGLAAWRGPYDDRVVLRTPLCELLRIDAPILCAPVRPVGPGRAGGWRSARRGGLGALGTAVRSRAGARGPVARAARAHRPAVRDQPHHPAVRRGRLRGDAALRAARDLVPHRRHPRADRARRTRPAACGSSR